MKVFSEFLIHGVRGRRTHVLINRFSWAASDGLSNRAPACETDPARNYKSFEPANPALVATLSTHDLQRITKMPKQKNDSAPSPVKPGMPEPTTDTAEAAASKDEAAAESQVAAATSASDSPEATATSPVKHHAVGNQGMPEHTSDPNPSPAQSGATEPTSPQDDTSEPGATKDEAGAESQVPAAPSNTPENSLPLTTEESVRQPAEADDGGWFVPFIPQAPEPPAPKPAPKPKPSPLAALMDKWLRDNCPTLTPTDATPETASPAPPAAAVSDGVEATQPSETAGEPAEEPLPPPRVATAPSSSPGSSYACWP